MAKQTFTTGQVLTAAQMTSLQQTAMGGGAATAKTTSYTLVAADAGTTIIMNSASSTTITVNTGLFTDGDTVMIQNIGAGVCTVTAGTATVSTAGSLALSQYEAGTLYFVSTGVSNFIDYVQASSSGGMTSIQSGSLSGTTTSLTSIPGTYKDLRLVLRNVYMTASSTVYQLQFNTDTGANYTYIWQNGTAATNVANGVNQFQTTASFPTTSNNQCTIMMNVYDYTSTTNYKLADLAAVGASGDPGVFNTAFYKSSSAITSIQIKGNGQTVAGTYTLYGIN